MFFYINPEIADDPQLRHVNNVTLSNTLFQTDVDHEHDKDEEARARMIMQVLTKTANRWRLAQFDPSAYNIMEGVGVKRRRWRERR